MSTSHHRVARALAWWETLPTDLRPTQQDVEIAARLRVTRVEVMARASFFGVAASSRQRLEASHF